MISFPTETLNFDAVGFDNKAVYYLRSTLVYPINWNVENKIIITYKDDFNVTINQIWESETEESAMLGTEKICFKRHIDRRFEPHLLGSYTKDQNCYNGGIFSDERCICPPGFTGNKCKISCGDNHYGDKCERRCSPNDRKCAGIILCTPYLGCKCASGYKGEQCLETCNKGFYGADCEQTCGQCNGTCDKFTGHCEEGCKSPYYIEPLCQNAHSYFKEAPNIIESTFDSIKLKVNLAKSNTASSSDSQMFYMIQYKEEGQNNWVDGKLKVLDKIKTEDEYVIENLNQGQVYKFRAILLNELLEMNDPDITGISTGSTKCNKSEPTIVFNYKTVTNSSVTLVWKEEVDVSFGECKTLDYTIEIDSVDTDTMKREIKGIRKESIEINGLLPESNYLFSIKRRTAQGVSNSMANITIRTEKSSQYFEQVLGLAGTVNKSQVNLKWLDLPKNNNNTFFIKYKLYKHMACPQNTPESTWQVKESSESTYNLTLEPFSVYKIFVSRNRDQNSAHEYLTVSTQGGIPEIAPGGVDILNITNTRAHFRLQKSPLECLHLNGFFKRHFVQYLKIGSDFLSFKKYNTSNNEIILKDLMPGTSYTMMIFYVNHVGMNLTEPYIATFTTKESQGAFVENLIAYKTTQNMIGLRWKMNTAGNAIKIEVRSKTQNKTVEVTELGSIECKAWSTFSCFNITGLQFNTSYLIAVFVISKDYPQGGEQATISALTKETKPSAVEKIWVSNMTTSSITLLWKIPNILNGILRKFVIEIEQQSTFDETLCCQSNEIFKVLVHEEKETYSYLIENITNASTYQVTVKAYTRKLGPPTSELVDTLPPLIPLKIKPNSFQYYSVSDYLNSIITVPKVNLTWVQNNSTIELPEKYDDLITDMLIIIQSATDIHNDTKTHSNITNDLSRILNTTNWWLAHVCIKEGPTCSLTIGDKVITRTIHGEAVNRALESNHAYTIVVVQVNKYKSANSYTIMKSAAFVIEKVETTTESIQMHTVTTVRSIDNEPFTDPNSEDYEEETY